MSTNARLVDFCTMTFTKHLALTFIVSARMDRRQRHSMVCGRCLPSCHFGTARRLKSLVGRIRVSLKIPSSGLREHKLQPVGQLLDMCVPCTGITIRSCLDISDVLSTTQEDLKDFIQNNQVECLNESAAHTKAALFTDDGSYLESDCDEQLLITIPFNQNVKIHSVRIKAPSDGMSTVLFDSIACESRRGPYLLFIVDPAQARRQRTCGCLLIAQTSVSTRYCCTRLLSEGLQFAGFTIVWRLCAGGQRAEHPRPVSVGQGRGGRQHRQP